MSDRPLQNASPNASPNEALPAPPRAMSLPPDLGPVSLDRSGRGVRVAIVDSGVDPLHPWLEGARVAHVGVEKQGELFTLRPSEPGDQSGHGTACAGIIHRMAPEAELTSVRAFGPDGRCSRDGLIAALRYCVRERFSVVNLSLGIDFPRGAPLRPIDL